MMVLNAIQATLNANATALQQTFARFRPNRPQLISHWVEIDGTLVCRGISNRKR